MKESAGIVIRLDGSKILLCQPSGSNNNFWGPPKGGINGGESILDAAIRETSEEIGININIDLIKDQKPIIVDYSNRKGTIYKRVYLFIFDIRSISEINLETERVPKSLLQSEEISDAYFMDKKEMMNNIFHRFYCLIDLI